MKSSAMKKIVVGAAANLLVLFLIFAFFGMGFALFASIAWAFAWMLYCSKQENEESSVSHMSEALIGGVFSWVACLFQCFIPGSYEKNSSSPTWNGVSKVVETIANSFGRAMSYLHNFCK